MQLVTLQQLSPAMFIITNYPLCVPLKVNSTEQSTERSGAWTRIWLVVLAEPEQNWGRQISPCSLKVHMLWHSVSVLQCDNTNNSTSMNTLIVPSVCALTHRSWSVGPKAESMSQLNSLTWWKWFQGARIISISHSQYMHIKSREDV